MSNKKINNHGIDPEILRMANELAKRSSEKNNLILISIPSNDENDSACYIASNGNKEGLEDAILGAIASIIEDNDLNFMEMRDLKHDIDDLIEDDMSIAKLNLFLETGMNMIDDNDDNDDDNDNERNNQMHRFNGFEA